MPALSLTGELAATLVAVAILSLAALSQVFARRVPNALTLPAILAGWAFAGFVDARSPQPAPWPEHALVASLLGTFLALLIMLPAYGGRGLGAGCVKAQMAFAAWVGIALPLGLAMGLVLCATLGGLAVTFGLINLLAANLSAAQRSDYQFPAQVTMTGVSVVGAIACWMMSNPM